MTKRPSGELKRLAREFLTGNYITPILAMLIAAFLPVLLLSPFSAGITPEWNMNTVTNLIAVLIIEVLAQLLTVGVIRIHLLLAYQKQLPYAELFWTFRNRPDRFILATLLLYGILLIPAVPAGVCMVFLVKTDSAARYGMSALAAVAFMVLELYVSYTFGLIYPLYIDHPQMSVLEGFGTSRTLMKGNKMRLFRLQLSFFGWYVLGICSAGIGMLWIQPYITQTTVNFYLDITGQLDRRGEHISTAV